MIHKVTGFELKLLNRISPSQYHSALSCPYKLVLANSFGYNPLLSINANAHFGSVAHKIIELISKGTILDEQTFSEKWVELINKKEDELKAKGLANITPLKHFVTDFGLKKNQIKNILQKRSEKFCVSQKSSTSKFYPEKKLENSDKSIIGIADLIIENELGTTILDFKTGKIYSDSIEDGDVAELVIKKEYEIQLKLYAHLYFLMTGEYPKTMYLVTLSNDFIEIKFNPTECEMLYLEVLDFMSKTNSFIAKGDIKPITNPSKENCKYCSYRPACNFYSEWITTNFEAMNDLYGKIEKVNQFNNNTLGLQLLTNDKEILINGLSTLLREDFEAFVGKNITLYNVKKTKQSLNATANHFTKIYER